MTFIALPQALDIQSGLRSESLDDLLSFDCLLREHRAERNMVDGLGLILHSQWIEHGNSFVKEIAKRCGQKHESDTMQLPEISDQKSGQHRIKGTKKPDNQ